MSESHSDIPPELRQLAQSLLDRLDPAVRLAAARATSGSDGKCQQVWCPVCALAALVTGERHPLLTVIAEHSVSLLAVVRAMTDALDQEGTDAPEPPPTDPPQAPGRYEHIPVTVED
ncbi:hypothetical protein TUM20985_22240 [Mycobacterium antarcticum]|uniref:hypothetical protein n=1 Tax=unclassified Mycolicibacterium TaxID=2636767 RepID=UPI0023926DE8|nr:MULTISPECIES: hypothetical protein [unclassified Mycolicibacterium]BDX31677.1 hypothetical protein TUM20985_22240 [Mycolicibacterium sp. TUM20985]GLP74974.1 hypothetical protein TUM20983_20840 [Mycolicibacterium sp. TUM20983]GLP80763.1 hypothetical protein TUM20984_21830 [Mycolicibacterium sp. TUM20984]